MPKILFSFLILLFICITFTLVLKKETKETQMKCVRIGQILIKVEIADTILKRSRGLGGRISLGDDEGMLFIFSEYARHPFWMKEMKFPLDIIWIKDDKIIDFSKNISPVSFPQSFKPRELVHYVLEVKAGFSEKYQIRVGQRVSYLDCQK